MRTGSGKVPHAFRFLYQWDTGECSIGKEAFYGQDEIRSIRWPSDLEIIEYRAFAGCLNLNFDNFPDKLRYIGKYAFKDCDLKELTLPVSLSYLGSLAFGSENKISILHLNSRNLITGGGTFKALTHLIIGPEVEYIDKLGLGPKLRIVRFEDRDESTPLRIGDSAFAGCEALSECLLPDATTSIGEYAFSNCKNVDLGEIPPNINYIGSGAFRYVEREYAIHNLQMDSIPDETFSDFKGLKEITFAHPLKYLGNACFAGTSISTFHLPALLMNADKISYPFEGGSMYYPIGCDNLKTVTFEDGTYKFNISLKGTAIENLEVPEGVKEFGTRVPNTLKTLSLPADCLDFDKYMLNHNNFVHITWRNPDGFVFESNPDKHCIPERWYGNMRTYDFDMILPEGFGSIEDFAFEYSSLNMLSLPSTLNYVSRYAFSQLDVNQLEFRSVIPPRTDNYERVSVGNVGTIIVPFGTKEVYQESFAKGLENKIVERPGRLDIKLDTDTLLMEVGNNVEVNLNIVPAYVNIDTQISWISSNPIVADVLMYHKRCIINAKAAGKCDITVSFSFRDALYTTDVHVIVTAPPAESVTLYRHEMALTVGQSETLKATVVPAEAVQEVEWASMNPEIATVDADGTITGLETGTTVVTASTTDGSDLTASCLVTVTEADGIFSVTCDSMTVIVENGSEIIIQGLAYDEPVMIVDLAGTCVYAGPDRRISGLGAGMYIVIADGAKVKVILR